MTDTLNLVELLHGCEGESFFCLILGDCTLSSLKDCDLPGAICVKNGKSIYCGLLKNGKVTKDGCCLLFPSRELYEKFPLDPEAAWLEWDRNCIQWQKFIAKYKHYE